MSSDNGYSDWNTQPLPTEEAIQEWEDLDSFQSFMSTVTNLSDLIDASQDPSDPESIIAILNSITDELPGLLEKVLVLPPDLYDFIRRISNVENTAPFSRTGKNGGFAFEIAPYRNSVKSNLDKFKNSKDLKYLIKAIEKYKEILLRITERWTSLSMPYTSDTVANRYDEIDVILKFLKSQVEG
jgi:hypothetical protein